MGLKRTQVLARQKAYFEDKLQARLSSLSGQGIKSPQADKDTLVRKFRADIRAVNKRLRTIADNEKRAAEIAKIKADKAATPQKEQGGGKGQKPKKAPEEGKRKTMSAEPKPAPPKAPEGDKSRPPTEAHEDGQATIKAKREEAREGPAGQGKAGKP